MTSSSLEDAAIIESLTANGLKLEYITIGEKISAKIKKKPTGPTRYLYQGVRPNYFVLKISA